MVTSTPDKIVEFESAAEQSASVRQQLGERGREYLDTAVAAAREHPLAAAAVGAGVVAVAAAGAYGVAKLASRNGATAEGDSESVIDPEVIPQALPIE